MAIKVKLRHKKISNDRTSLYLDFYPAIPSSKTGKLTRREVLGMYVYNKPTNAIDKQHNKETLLVANQIRQKRENTLNKPEVYTEFEKQQLRQRELGELNFVEYFKKLANKRKESNHGNWMSAYLYLESFTNGHISFANVNEKFCIDFKEYLLTTKSHRRTKTKLSQNSAHSYFNKVKATLKQAYKEEYLSVDINAKVESIKPAETQRNFLTIEELRKVASTDCAVPVLKNAALFSALTGLRFSDIKNLVWGDIEFREGDGYYIRFKQQKTQGFEDQPITDYAFHLLGPRKEATDRVFEDLVYSATNNKYLFKWLVNAGITKDITFHCFRHTYATLLLRNADIYTVSKMLGHKHVKTTQIYAKVMNQTKRAAANTITLEL